MKFQKYTKYKASGVDWLGEIPEEWEVKRLKDVSFFSRGFDLSLSTTSKGKYPIQGSNGIIGYHNLFTTKSPSITIGRSGSVGEVNFINKDYWAHNTCLYLLKNFKNDIKYLFYLLYSLNVGSLASGTAVGTLNRNLIHKILIKYPPKQTQTKIANYLDEKTNLIDKKISLLQKKKEKYKELKQTLINEVVTKGLGKNVKMKNSEIEWIGEIPEHWEVKRLKDIYKMSMGNTILQNDLIDNGIIPVYSATEEDKYFGYVNNANLIIKEGDLVIPARGNSIGYVKIVDKKSTTTQTTIACRKISINIISKYIYYFLQGNKINIFKFDNTAIPQFTVEDANYIKITIPPKQEQIQIANYLDEKTKKIDDIIEKIDENIEVFKEFRKTLINDAVTGKIKVA